MEILSQAINLSFISLSIFTVVRAIDLLRKSKIERVFLSEEKKILIHITRIVFLVLLFSVFSLIILEWVSGQKVSDVNDEELLKVSKTALTLGLMITMIIYMYAPIVSFISGKQRYYYINHIKHGQLYVLRFTNNDHVILSDKRRLDEDQAVIILEKRDNLLSIPIQCEIEKENMIMDIKKLIAKKKLVKK